MLQNNLIQKKQITRNDVNYTSYEIKPEQILNILFFPRSLNFIEKKYGENARLIFEQFIEFGVLTLKQIIEQIQNIQKNGNNLDIIKSNVLDIFIKLYSDNLITYAERPPEESNLGTNNLIDSKKRKREKSEKEKPNINKMSDKKKSSKKKKGKKDELEDNNAQNKNMKLIEDDEDNESIKDSKENLSDCFGGAAFVTFNKIKDQELFLNRLPKNFFEYIVKFFKNVFFLFCSCCVDQDSTSYYVRNATFEAAPEPVDIIFENIETKPVVRILKTALVYFISVILCGISFAAIYGLNLLQMYVDENQKNHTTHVVLLYVISFAITGVTSGMDILLQIVLEILTKWENQVTWTNYYLSFSLKLTLFSFVNSAILPTFCEFFINNSDGYEILISNMLMKFLVNAIVTPGMWTLNVGYISLKN